MNSEDFKAKSWQEIPFKVLLHNTLAFFSSEGFHYYVPAYKIASIQKHYEADVIPGDLLGLFAPPTKQTPDRKKSHDLFNKEQASVIVKFLQFV